MAHTSQWMGAHWRLYGPAADIRAVAQEVGLDRTAPRGDSPAPDGAGCTGEACLTFFPATVSSLAAVMGALWERDCLEEVRLCAGLGSPEAPTYCWEPISKGEFAEVYLSRDPKQFVHDLTRRMMLVIETVQRAQMYRSLMSFDAAEEATALPAG